MRSTRFLQVFIALLGFAVAAATPIIENGQPKAQIVIASERPRLLSLAALELQYYLEKMSGARLPIVTEPAAGVTSIYVGRTPFTDQQGVSDAGLKYGAYHMKVGPDWLILLGHDFDYQPPKPYPASRNAIPAAVAEWDKLTAGKTDSAWELPWSSLFKAWWNPRDFDKLMSDRYGADDLKIWNPHGYKWTRGYYDKDAGTGYWMHDESGSLNAVYDYLRSLGVRWYMPGDLGEVIPKMATIALPETVTETVKPDFAMRAWFWYNYSAFSYDHVMWARRLGMNNGYEVLGNIGHAHGLTKAHGRKEMQEKHPDYYALYGGVRDTEHRGSGTACHSSEGLTKEAIAFGRFMFDHYNQPHISLFPADGFKQCACEQCAGKTASELVWGFVDRVARELYKTHPDRIVSCGAYTSYVNPPDSIEKFSPNVAVFICNRGRALLDDPTKWDAYWSQIQAWTAKLGPGRLVRVENNRYTLNNGKPIEFPALHPHAMAKDLKALNGLCLGEYDEESQHRGAWKAPGCDHLNLYVNARFLWDADQDIETVLDDYFTKFYGPVAAEMKEAFTLAEANYNKLRLDVDSSLTEARINSLKASVDFASRLTKARDKAGADTVYGKRIQFILDELIPLEKQQSDLEYALTAPDPRADAPVIVGREAGSKEAPATYELKDIADGSAPAPAYKTTFQVRWEDKHLVFDVTCKDDDMAHLYITDNVWGGDSVAFLLETATHAYYQIEVNPDGVVFDADRKGGVISRWESETTVKTERGADFWRVIVSIPVVSPQDNEGDPFHYVVGAKPTMDKLWYVQVGRARQRQEARSAQSFIPTGGTYHDKAKFAKLAIQ